MSINAVFLVKSPLQYLNAIEARHHFGLRGEECLLLLLADKKSLLQMMNLVQIKSDWGSVFHVADISLTPGRNSLKTRSRRSSERLFLAKSFLNILKLRKLAAAVKPLEYVFLGDMGHPLMRHFGNLLCRSRTVLLDDGNATLVQVRSRYADDPLRLKLSQMKKLKLAVKRSLLGLRDRTLLKVTFFSAYELPVQDPDQLVPNHYALLRSLAQTTPETDSVYFLGGPLVEAGILSEKEYFLQLESVAAILKEKKVVYVVHRRELPEKIKNINTRFGWTIEKFEYPIEYQLALIGPRPQCLCSFISAALENCRLIFGDKLSITSYKLNPTYFALVDMPKGQGMKEVYRHYKENSDHHFQVVDL